MARTIEADAIAKVLIREYERGLTRAYKVLPFANRKYEGNIANIWDSVIIPYLTIGDWNDSTDPNRDIPESDLEIKTHKLVVNQYKDIRIKLSDKEVSLLWADIKTTQEIVRQMKEKAQIIQENYFVSKLLSVSNTVDSPLALTAANIYSEIVRMQVELDKKNVPEDDRQLFISPLIAWILLDSRKIEAFPDGYKPVSTGEMGMLAWFTIVKTNALFWANEKKMLWHQGKAGAFVEKINKIKIMESPTGNYHNLIGWLFFDADVIGENKKKVLIYEGA